MTPNFAWQQWSSIADAVVQLASALDAAQGVVTDTVAWANQTLTNALASCSGVCRQCEANLILAIQTDIATAQTTVDQCQGTACGIAQSRLMLVETLFQTASADYAAGSQDCPGSGGTGGGGSSGPGCTDQMLVVNGQPTGLVKPNCQPSWIIVSQGGTQLVPQVQDGRTGWPLAIPGSQYCLIQDRVYTSEKDFLDTINALATTDTARPAWIQYMAWFVPDEQGGMTQDWQSSDPRGHPGALCRVGVRFDTCLQQSDVMAALNQACSGTPGSGGGSGGGGVVPIETVQPAVIPPIGIYPVGGGGGVQPAPPPTPCPPCPPTGGGAPCPPSTVSCPAPVVQVNVPPCPTCGAPGAGQRQTVIASEQAWLQTDAAVPYVQSLLPMLGDSGQEILEADTLQEHLAPYGALLEAIEDTFSG